MIRDRELFKDLDENFCAEVSNANGSRSEIRGRGTVRCGVKGVQGNSCTLELTDALLVPSYARNLVSVKRLADRGAKVKFDGEPCIQIPNGTVVPMLTSDALFSVEAQPLILALTMMSHSLKH